MCLKSGVEKDHETISKECIKMVRDKIGPVAAFKIVIVIKRLPKPDLERYLEEQLEKLLIKKIIKCQLQLMILQF